MSQPTPPAVRAAPSAAVGPYVINLCASMTPMALSRPTAPELARFTFFVSRRREEGRERFRLHMGYFQTRDEAEELLALIRDLYPAAWVGEAPGKRLAARGAAQGASAASAGSAPVSTPTAKASTPAAMAAERKRPAASGSVVASNRPAAPSAAKSAAAVAAKAATTAAPRPAPVVGAAAAKKVPPSNVREVIASLDAPSPATPAAPPSPTPVADTQARHPVAASPKPAGAPATARMARAADELSDSQVLRILETRRANAAGQPAAPGARAGASDIRMLNPDDTQTWRDIRAQIKRDAAVHFAVQLAWSVTPIDLERIPGLAIFNSYTLYKVEGNREGRRWYGLRLGFFSDAVAARQVALYVRSEFASVAVVPVSAKERSDAMQVGAIELPRPALATSARRDEDEFELFDDADDAAVGTRNAAAEAAGPPPAARSASAPKPAAQPAPAPAPAGAARRPNRPRGSPQTLEETLEILGASQLSIDDGKGVRLDLGTSTGGGRRTARAGPRNTTFSKLLERLTEKLRS